MDDSKRRHEDFRGSACGRPCTRACKILSGGEFVTHFVRFDRAGQWRVCAVRKCVDWGGLGSEC